MPDPDSSRGPAPDTGDVRAVHSGLRREFAMFPELWTRASVEGDTAHTAALLDHWALITACLRRHHEGEDELLWPLLHARAPEAGGELARMLQQHHRMLDELAAADAVVAGAGVAGADPDLSPLHRLADSIAEHFDDEEATALPLCQAHLSVPEWLALGVHARAGLPPEQAPIVICLILDGADEAAAAAFTAQMPAEARALASGEWQAAYERYRGALRGT